MQASRELAGAYHCKHCGAANDDVVEGERLRLPLAGVERGALRFTSGVSDLALGTHGGEEDLLRASFRGPAPSVRASGGEVRVHYADALFDWIRQLLHGERPAADLSVSSRIPWRILIEGGVTQVHARVDELSLEALEIRGGASELDWKLPRPKGTVPLSIRGGASRVRFTRPPDVPVRLSVRGGVSHLRLDAQELAAVGGRLELETPGYATAEHRYALTLSGGASHLTVTGW